MVEQTAVNRLVAGSIPAVAANLRSVGEVINTHAFHACMHGFESHTDRQRVVSSVGEQLPYKQ